MNKERESKLAPPVVGGSSLLSIFSVLCLVIFALLMLQTNRNNLKLAETSAEAVEAYYEADCQAEEILAQIREGQLPQGVTLSKNPEEELYSYSCQVSENQVLDVEVQIDGNEYEVLKWKTTSTAQKEKEPLQDMWEGDRVTDLGK